ncbi:MAG: hypothetical protein QG670_1814 [Thermoproteota archaeon]|nr:hypothetical protein [Thermoproteota archaeon]
MIDDYGYQQKYRRFVQGMISEDEFKRYIFTQLTKDDLIEIIVSSAKSLREAIAIGEPLHEH